MKKNVPALGFIIGLILPVFGLLLVYLLKFSDVTLSLFLKTLFSNGDLAGKILTLSVLVNLIPFVYYTNKRLDYTARGLFYVTMIYVLLILMVMYVWN